MALAPHHEIAELTSRPGELSFEARIDGTAQRIWFRTESEVTPNADAALAACLTPAMRSGGTLRMSEPISPRLLRNQREFQAIQRSWSRGWGLDGGPLAEVELSAPTREPSGGETGRVAAFFSGGVDSWWTALEFPELTDLIFIRGYDLLQNLPQHAGLVDSVEERMREAADQLGLRLHVVETNLRELSDPLVPWLYYYGSAAAAVALFLAPLFDRVLVTTDCDYEVQEGLGTNWLVDRLLGTEDLQIVDTGGLHNRIERLRQIAPDPRVQRSLRVCWENRDGAYNCGCCQKCLLTMVGLELIGARDHVTTFPADLDLAAVAEAEMGHPVALSFWEDLLDASRLAGRRDFERALETVIEKGKRDLGLPASRRCRLRPGPPAVITSRYRARARQLRTTPATAEAIAASGAVAVLVGSYDGSGNFGDLLQLDAALELLEPFGPGLLPLPVLERQYLDSHRSLSSHHLSPIEHALYFDQGDEDEDGMVAIPPAQLDFAAIYLYGGGYLNSEWGPRKLEMLRAVEDLLATRAPSQVSRIASGLQVDPSWLGVVDDETRRLLGRFELLGARDGRSREGLATFESEAEVLDGGDDAIGALGNLAPSPVSANGLPTQVNVHLGAHQWAGQSRDSAFGFHAAVLAELSRRGERPIAVQPLVAYLDERVDERPGVDRLAAACSPLGIEVTEPLVLRPDNLADLAPRIGEAALTLSSSYHIALTSMMLGVPSVLLQDNPYYRQKSEGLAADFGPSPAFVAATSGEGGEVAAEIADAVFDRDCSTRLRRHLAERADALRERRGGVEAELLRKLGLAGPGGGPMPRAEIAALECAPGELSFEARIAGREQRVWFRTDSEVTPNADAALAACLLPAMRSGGSLLISEPVSARLLRGQREYQAIQRAWSWEWDLGERPLREVEVEAPSQAREPAASGRVAAFFSGGVDSLSTVLTNDEVTDLIFVRGIDLLPNLGDPPELIDEVERRLRAAAAELELPLHVVETNIRELSDPLVRWEAYNPSALAAVALFLAPLFDRVLIASDTDHATQVPLGASRLIDQLWSTEALEIADVGGLLTREQRTRAISDSTVAQRTLRVCWENPGGAYNCGRCRKCLVTMVALEAIGARERFSSFPAELDLSLMSDFEINQPISLVLWEDVLETARRAGRSDLEQALEPLLAKGRRDLGLAATYRVTEDGPPPWRRPEPPDPSDELEALRLALRVAEQRAEEAKAGAEGSQQQLETIVRSRSWRLAEPLRRLGAYARRLRARLRTLAKRS